ncbi:hypothetical protein ACT3SP_18440 [Brachybacterium sp. AOP43-C2-M15]|uniref:hypothetical protein n=1 Tax=Brachybacterium sp. AOP43-C2-M15 TaxID=3457661 RepID=UPI00403463F3
MEELLVPVRPVGRRATGPPPVPIGLCAAWSRHAAELAVPIGGALQRWEETPSTRVMVAEGQLVRLLPEIFLPPDLLCGAVERALALGCAMGAHLQSHHVIAGPSAAWVVLGGAPPSPAELLSPAHRGERAGLVLRHARLHPGDVETIGGAPVTVPVRTAMDLLRFAAAPVAGPALRGLVAAGHMEVDEVRERLRRMHRHPGVQAARDRLEALLATDPVTRDAPEISGG